MDNTESTNVKLGLDHDATALSNDKHTEDTDAIMRNPNECVASVDIEKWLDAPDSFSAYDFFLSLRRGLEASGQWFMKSAEYLQFEKDNRTCLWLTGDVGAGKSVLSATVVQDLKNKYRDRGDVAIIHAFLKETECSSILNIYAALLRQSLDYAQGKALLEAAYTRLNGLGAKLVDEEAFSILKLFIDSFYKVYIIADGLNEVPDDLMDRLLTSLNSLGATLLITARSSSVDKHIARTPGALRICIEERSDDVEVFVAARVKRSKRVMTIFRNGEQPLIDRLTNKLQEKSGGNFLLARLQMDALKVSHSINAIFKALETMPMDLTGLYHRTIKRIDMKSREDYQAAHRALIWAGNAVRPLKSEELQYALAVNYNDEEFDTGELIPETLLYGMCGGLIFLKEFFEEYKDQEVRFIHPTVIDFCRNDLRFKEVPPSQSFLAVTCTVYLAFHLEEIQKRETAEAYHAFVESQPFLSYAIDNWAYHARLSQKDEGQMPKYILKSLTACRDMYPKAFHIDARLNGLHLAAKYGLVQAITARSIPQDFVVRDETADGFTPFHYAVSTGQVEILKALLDNFSGVNIQSTNGDTPLHLAVRANATEFVDILISFANSPQSTLHARQARGLDGYLDVNARNHEGLTPLAIACQSDSGSDVLKKLLSYPGLGVNVRDSQGRPPLWHACHNHATDAAANALVAAHPDLEPGVADADGNTAFMEACLSGHGLLVQSMLTHTDLAQQENAEGHSTFWRLCCYGGLPPSGSGQALDYIGTELEQSHVRIMESLIRADVAMDINKRDEEGMTALMHVVLTGSVQKAQLLLSSDGIDLNAQDHGGFSALMHACHSEAALRGRVIEVLLQKEALDVNLRNVAGKSALEIFEDSFVGLNSEGDIEQRQNVVAAFKANIGGL